MPQLRSLLLGGNNITMAAYNALQSVIGWSSLQSLDLSYNAISGALVDALALYACVGMGSNGCSRSQLVSGAATFNALFLQGNTLTGTLPSVVDKSTRASLNVLDVSDNLNIMGGIPDNYSSLLMLFTEGTGLSGASLPSFVSAGAEYEVASSGSVCPTLEPAAGGDMVALSIDTSYLNQSMCLCGDGLEGAGDSCTSCPTGTYRDLDQVGILDTACTSCPTNATTLETARWDRGQCVCKTDFYDQLGGLGVDSPSCLACPAHSRTVSLAATNATLCECSPGYYRQGEACEACPAGTYKSAYGNDPAGCLPCPAGSFSVSAGASDSSACTPCPLGTYSNFTGAVSPDLCLSCPRGTYAILEGKQSLCTPCWAGYYSPVLNATSVGTCIPCPTNTSLPTPGGASRDDCTPCESAQVAVEGSSSCSDQVSENGTLVGLWLLILGIFMVLGTIAWVILNKKCHQQVPMTEKVHMKLNEEMKTFIMGQQFWISLFSGVEIMDLMSDLGAYASLLYKAALTGWIKIVYTVMIAFALMASLHGVHTRATILMDMQEERKLGLAITGNDMLYYEKQFNILQIMTQKRRCQKHVPFDRGNKYMSHHIGVQRLISLNSMRIIIAIFEDVPSVGLTLFLIVRQPELAASLIVMTSFVISIFVLGYKMTLFEKHARLQIRKWNLEARMDTDTMLNKKAARGRRFSWACEQCQ
ncbi:unnamed protein product, partial [Discosporangium mesarthrocarpum]